MRVTCDSCGKVYVVEERLRGRAFRMRCRRCAHAIAVQPDPPAAAPEPVAAPARAAPADRWESDDAFADLARDLQEFLDEPTPAPAAADAAVESRSVASPPPRPAPPPVPPRPAVAVAAPPRPAPRPELPRAAVPVPPRRPEPPPAPPRADLVAPGSAEATGERPAPVVEPSPVLAVDPTARRRWRRAAAATVAALASVGVVAAALAWTGRSPAAAPATRRAVPAGLAPVAAAPAAPPDPAERVAAPQVASPPEVGRPEPVATAPAPERMPERRGGAARSPPRVAAATAVAPSSPRSPPSPPPVATAAAPADVPPAPPRGALPPRDGAETAAVLARNAPVFDACISDARRDEPYLLASPRSVVLTMTVRPSGQAAYATLDDAQLSGTALGACIKRRGAAIAFPEAGGEPVRVRMPLALGP